MEFKKENLGLYELGRNVPEDAKQPIDYGALKGKTSINPMFRIKTLTKMFGPAGIGFWFTPVVYNDVEQPIFSYERLNEKYEICFCSICLHYRYGDNEAKPIMGCGSSYAVRDGKFDEDHRKKAYTDAQSVCCKLLGIGADVYWTDHNQSKYTWNATTAPDIQLSMQPQEMVPQGQVPQQYQQPMQYAPQGQYPQGMQYAPQGGVSQPVQQYPQDAQYQTPQGYQTMSQGQYQQEAQQPYVPQGQPPQVTSVEFASVDEAKSWKITFGRNKEKTIGQLLTEPRGREQLMWFINNRPECVEAKAAALVLKAGVMAG